MLCVLPFLWSGGSQLHLLAKPVGMNEPRYIDSAIDSKNPVLHDIELEL